MNQTTNQTTAPPVEQSYFLSELLGVKVTPVSYTHLTLPTIYSV